MTPQFTRNPLSSGSPPPLPSCLVPRHDDMRAATPVVTATASRPVNPPLRIDKAASLGEATAVIQLAVAFIPAPTRKQLP